MLLTSPADKRIKKKHLGLNNIEINVRDLNNAQQKPNEEHVNKHRAYSTQGITQKPFTNVTDLTIISDPSSN